MLQPDKNTLKVIISLLEIFLAGVVVIGVLSAMLGNVHLFLNNDWSEVETFYDFIYRILLIVIGLELARMLVVHDLVAVLELLAFIIARKLLKPDVGAWDIFISVGAFVLLLLARRFLLPFCSSSTLADKESVSPES